MRECPSLQRKMAKPSNYWFGYLIIDKDGTRVREMCIRWITKGKWAKLKGIYLGIFQINSGNNGLEVDQCTYIILSDFQVFKQIRISKIEGSKLDLALRNKKAR